MGAVAQRLDQGRISFERTSDSTLVVHLSGAWHLQRDLPPISLLVAELSSRPGIKRLAYETAELTHWDSGLISFLTNTAEICRARGIVEDRAGLPAGLRRMLELAEAVPEKKGARSEASRISFFERVGNVTIGYGLSVGEFLGFLGDLTLAFAKFLRGKARYRRSDLLEVIQECGPNAVGIVTLISFLVGVILAFMGAVQLSQFGASIYVADLVGIGMVRDMAAMMTAIIMSGRTGAAFAAKLGTMKVTQEIDALTTMGVSPLEFLVLPRVLALGSDDAAALPVCGPGRDTWRLVRRRRDARSVGRQLPARNHLDAHAGQSVRRHYQRNFLWRAYRDCRLSARLSVWQQLFGGRRCGDAGRGHGDRDDRGRLRSVRRGL
jgi:phospholipid/cholesterol/gamma-HCH transport system permease protein